jgi:flagellar operon protein
MNISNKNAILPNQINKNVNRQSQNINSNFNTILNNNIDKSQVLQFSKHANMRLNTRNISLSQDQLLRIEDGVNNANKKGINDSLILVDDIALVINIKTKTVITAMNDENSNIFTNIDGAVIV